MHHVSRFTFYASMPAIPANVFQNILRLEEQKGFTDAAVAGGLEAFARRWAEQVAGAGGHERGGGTSSAAAVAGALEGYSRIDEGARRAAVRRAAQLLAGLDVVA